MATNTSLCAICNLRHLTTSSTHWCPECEEALCVECKEHHILSKASRGHNVIPISEYNSLPPFIASINIFCTYHNEKYTQYCVKHEVPICYKCITEHGHCDELTILEDVALGMKSSEVFREMEQSVNDLMVNINRIRSDRESNLKILKVKKTQIFEVVSSFIETITRYLDRLQRDFMTELDKVEAECCDKIESIVSSLNAQYEEMIQCNAEIENIKKYASDIQLFLGVKKIQKNITQNEQWIQSMVQNKLVEKVSLDFTFDTKMLDFMTNDGKFGSIKVQSCPFDSIKLVSKTDRQAQEPDSVYNIQFNFKRELQTSCVSTSGCSTTKDRYLFTDSNEYGQKLVAIDLYGENEYILKLNHQHGAYDLTCIDDNTVAVTTGYLFRNTGILIIDLKTRKIKRFIELSDSPYGITFDGKSLICCSNRNCIHIISCTDFSCTNIPSTCMPPNSYITTHGDNIFCSVPESHKVIVYCLKSGKVVWEFINEKMLKYPGGITVDDKGNVFVVDFLSKSILVISPDGKQYKQIQTREYGLTQPMTIFYDKIRKQLLVSNFDDFAHVYDISYL